MDPPSFLSFGAAGRMKLAAKEHIEHKRRVLLHISWNGASRAETFVVQASACSVRDHAKACTTNIEAYGSTIYAEEPKYREKKVLFRVYRKPLLTSLSSV
jgi:hypothetical protein